MPVDPVSSSAANQIRTTSGRYPLELLAEDVECEPVEGGNAGQIGDALQQERPAEDGRRGRAEPGHPTVEAEVQHGGSKQDERAAKHEVDDGGRRIVAADDPGRDRDGVGQQRGDRSRHAKGSIAWVQSSYMWEWNPSISRAARLFVGAIPAVRAGLALDWFRWLPRWRDRDPDGQ